MVKFGTSSKDIEKAAKILKKGGLVAFPTETVYGLGADAFNTHALARIFEVKGRPYFDPLIIHIAKIDSLELIASLDDLNAEQRKRIDLLVNKFWPGPLTLVLPKRREVPDLATSALPTAAVRFPSHPVARELISLSTGAVAAPSANRFGHLSPTRGEHVMEMFPEGIDCIIDGGPCSVGVESTVLALVPSPHILRPGGISREQLEKVIGPVLGIPAEHGDLKCDQVKQENADLKCDQVNPAEHGDLKCDQVNPEHADLKCEQVNQEHGDLKCDQVKSAPSPGMLQNHYAPGIPLFLHSQKEIAALLYHQNEGYLFFSGKSRDAWQTRQCIETLPDNVFVLSEKAILTEAAANLFEFLHVLDRSGAVCIHAETVPGEGIGEAINDRLQRAAVK